MDARSRKALQPIYQCCLPPGFSGEEHDDFIDYSPPGSPRSCRVVRLVGPGRHIVLFSFPRDPCESARGPRDYRLLYLHEDGSLVPFDPKAIEAAWTPRSSHQLYFPWDAEVGRWLAANGARSFRGTNWVGQVSALLVTLLPSWRRDHSGMAPSPDDIG